MEILKKTSLGDLIIKPVDKATAKQLIIENHYSRKWNDASFGKYNFGIFYANEPDRCLGVAAYGYMKNCRAKIFTSPLPRAWICELNRLWISDELGHNAESILISASIKLLRQIDKNIVAIQSFVDGRLGCGTIYKAANFKYYGHHNSLFHANNRTGEIIQDQILTDSTLPSGYIRSNIAYLLGDFKSFKVKTYRYVYPLSKHFYFKFKEKPFPQYEKGMTYVDVKRDREKIKSNIVKLLNRI